MNTGFKRFWGFVKKEYFHIVRDPRSLLILLGIPIAQILIFGYVLKNDIRNVPIAVYDQSHDHLSRQLVEKLTSSGYFYIADEITEFNGVEKSFRSGKVKLVVVIEQHFAQAFTSEKKASVQLLADASDANTAKLIVQYVQGVLQSFVAEQNPTFSLPATIDVRSRMLYNEEMSSAYMFIPGVITLLLMLISAMMTSISLAREKEQGTMQAILVSPLKPLQIVAGKVTPYVALSLINAIVILSLGYLVFGVPVRGSLTLLMSICLLYIIMSLCLGILISTVAPNQVVAMLISMFALLLPTMLLSGFIFPIENMPKWLQYFSLILPPRYFLIILKTIMLKGLGLAYIWKEVLILCLFTLGYLGISVKKFKVRLE